MDSKIFKVITLMAMCFLLNACFLPWNIDKDNVNQIRLINPTNDTLILSVIEKHLCPTCPEPAVNSRSLFPNENILLIYNEKKSCFDMKFILWQ